MRRSGNKGRNQRSQPRGNRGQRNQRKGLIPYSLAASAKNMFQAKCYTSAVVANNGGATIGRFWQAHPAYGVNGGSVSRSFYTRAFANSNATTSGLAPRFVMMHGRMKFTITNLEAFPIAVTVVAYPSLQASTLSVSNYGSSLIGAVTSKTIFLTKTGVAGYIKSVSIDIDTAKLEGLDAVALQQTSYWAQYNSAASLYQAVYLQIEDATASNVFTAAGIAVVQQATYDCMLVGGPVTSVSV